MSIAQFQPSEEIQMAIKAIREMTPIVDAEDDYLTIVAAEEMIAAKAAQWKRELEASHSQVKSLARTLEAARASSTRPSNIPSAAEHAKTVNDLDATRLSLAKAINDAESAQSAREAELAALKDEARRLEEYDVEADRTRELSADPLRMQIFRGLGFDPVLDREGKPVKILIRSKSGDIYSVECNSRPDCDQIEKLWKLPLS